jgi:anti-sigma factor RsiW
MSDCTNIEMREWLPELLHGRLDAATRAGVERHLESCGECRAEYELLLSARASLQSLMPVDKRAIIAALPRAGTRQAVPTHRTRNVWRVAAAVAVLVLGGLSFNAVRESPDGRVTALGDTTGQGAIDTGEVVAIADTPLAGSRGSLPGEPGFPDLADDDLEALIGALDQLEAAPHVDPEANRFSRMVGGTTGGD